ncbi:hypothetical protein BP5796_11518 [Coleophoma crateriformis]|uniref:Amidoligase enzyme-domain-containing protein n=1 Tax=Coleophoma crateriformis TaxID=565419 RepID=A0A3D8QIG6_9HELO|nr:hypothetical protein BP5796_11518 [Coleophoma crateriformis]
MSSIQTGEKTAIVSKVNESISVKPPRGITYGIELELVFAFHESELRNNPSPALSPDMEIAKDLSLSLRRTAAFTNIRDTPLHIYNSWGKRPKHDSFAVPAPYTTEPQQILFDHLTNNDLMARFDIRDTMTWGEKAHQDYKRWLITKDYTVCGVGSHNLPEWLPNIVNASNHPKRGQASWDSIGLEIVSPVMHTQRAENRREIEEVVQALQKPANGTGVFITNQCGFHVHVEAPTDLKVLKTLALLILVYEEEISRLHPPCRQPNHPCASNNLESNRQMLTTKHRSDNETTPVVGKADCSIKALRSQLGWKELVQCFDDYVPEDDDIDYNLSRFMNGPATGLEPLGARGRLVNFTALARHLMPSEAGRARTVEFRQARGTLDHNDIAHWVDFCTGLVQLAHALSGDESRFSARFEGWDDLFSSGPGKKKGIDVFDLMADMGPCSESIRYWVERVERYQNCEIGGPLDRTDLEDEVASLKRDGDWAGDEEDDFVLHDDYEEDSRCGKIDKRVFANKVAGA